LLRKSKPKLKFITPLPNADFVRNFSHSIPPDLRDEWMVIQGQSHEVMGASNAVLLASGTATLEAMMFKKPMVIAYKMPWLSYQMMKGKGYMPYVGLPNIMAQQFAVPELLQSQATPEAIAEATLFQLDNDTNRKRLESLFLEKHLLLKRPSGELAANVLRQYLA
jgi:lipid-A-disaccharide synthase